MADTLSLSFDVQGFRAGRDVSLRLTAKARGSEFTARYQGAFTSRNVIEGEFFLGQGEGSPVAVTPRR